MEQLVKLIKKKLDSSKIKIKEVNLNIRFCEFTFIEIEKCKRKTEVEFKIQLSNHIHSIYRSDNINIIKNKENKRNIVSNSINFVSKSKIFSKSEIRSLICFELKGVCLTISGESNGIINVWNFNDNQHLYKLNGHTNNVNALIRVNIDENEYLASASKNTKVIIWDVENGRALFKLSGHIGSVYSLAVVNLRGFKCLASGSKDVSIII